jgi:hypothetical protein
MRLDIGSGMTHLFEEPRALGTVARPVGAWVVRHFVEPRCTVEREGAMTPPLREARSRGEPHEAVQEVLGTQGPRDVERHGSPAEPVQARTGRDRARPQASSPAEPADERNQVSIRHVHAESVREPRWTHASESGARSSRGREGGAAEDLRSTPHTASLGTQSSRERVSQRCGASEDAPLMNDPPQR